ATTRAPSDAERGDLALAWRVATHRKSNAIVFARDGVSLAIGAGAMSRAESVKTCERTGAGTRKGSAVASDAFVPFRDGGAGLADLHGHRAWRLPVEPERAPRRQHAGLVRARARR